MKTNIRLIVTAFIALFILNTGCKKSESEVAAPADANIAVTSGPWIISSFTQRGEDKTSDFTGMDFTFSGDSKLIVSGSENTAGTWSYAGPSSTYYGSSTGSFTISLGTGSPFKSLTGSWNILSQTASVLKLDAKEALEDEHVIFTKK